MKITKNIYPVSPEIWSLGDISKNGKAGDVFTPVVQDCDDDDVLVVIQCGDIKLLTNITSDILPFYYGFDLNNININNSDFKYYKRHDVELELTIK